MAVNFFRISSIGIVMLMLFPQQSDAQLRKKYSTYEEHHYKNMRYGLFKPAAYDDKKAYPLILYFHGANDTVSRDLSWYQESAQRENPCFVLTPKCLRSDQGWGNTWRDQHSPEMARTLSLVDSIVARYAIDRKRLYVYGISMGGFGVFSVLAKEPGKFAAAYAVCGGSSTEAASKVMNTPLWIFHGSADDIVPVALSRDVYNEIVRLGGKQTRYTEYPGVRHNSWENVSREKTLQRWLFLQKKGMTPGAPGAVADLKGQRQPDNAVKLTWNKPAGEEVWYYKIFRNNALLAEAAGDAIDFSDTTGEGNAKTTYEVVSVSYYFKESKPSVTSVE